MEGWKSTSRTQKYRAREKERLAEENRLKAERQRAAYAAKKCPGGLCAHRNAAPSGFGRIAQPSSARDDARARQQPSGRT